MANRILRDDPTKGDLHNRQVISWRDFRRSLADYDLWPTYLMTMTCGVPATTPNAYLTLTLRQLKFSTFNSNLMTIPGNFIFIVLNVGMAKLAQKNASPRVGTMYHSHMDACASYPARGVASGRSVVEICHSYPHHRLSLCFGNHPGMGCCQFW